MAETENKVRIALDLTVTQAERYNDLREACGINTKGEMFNQVMSFMAWAVEQKKQGRAIGSFDEATGKMDHIVMVPALEAVAKVPA